MTTRLLCQAFLPQLYDLRAQLRIGLHTEKAVHGKRQEHDHLPRVFLGASTLQGLADDDLTQEGSHRQAARLRQRAKATLPELLPAFHRHHIEDEDWRYADECLRELLKLVDLNDPFAAGLASTLIDPSSLGVLDNRAASDPAAATLHARQLDLLGGAPPMPERPQSTPQRPEKRYKRVPVGRFLPHRLADLLAAISGPDVAFDEQRNAVKRWVEHWSGKGRAVEALMALETQLDQLESGIIVEEALDSAYRASLAAEGKDAAFRWLVRAHVYRRGWASFWVSESEVMQRLEAAATKYPERWLEYVRGTSRPPPFWARRGYGFSVGQKYLVRFLLLAGQIEKAAEVTDVLVSSLLEEVQDQPVPPADWL